MPPPNSNTSMAAPACARTSATARTALHSLHDTASSPVLPSGDLGHKMWAENADYPERRVPGPEKSPVNTMVTMTRLGEIALNCR